MILLVHLLFGAAIGSAVGNITLAIILAFLSHYFLDFFPHIEYPIENINNKQWKRAWPELILVFIDFFLGAVLITLFSNNNLVYIYATLAILPDGVSVLGLMANSKIIKKLGDFHEKIHFLKYKKISIFWRIFSQISAVIISIIILRR